MWFAVCAILPKEYGDDDIQELADQKKYLRTRQVLGEPDGEPL